MIKFQEILKEHGDQPPYMYSKYGFGCHVCSYYELKEGKHHCNSKDYIEYMGTDELINPDTREQIKDPTKWCSNWFEPIK